MNYSLRNTQMQSLSKLFILLVALFLFSCQCKDVTCYNGGICVNGECDCPSTTEGEFCEIKIPNSFDLKFVEYKPSSLSFCLDGSPPGNTRLEIKIYEDDKKVFEKALSVLSLFNPSVIYSPNHNVNSLRDSYKIEIWRQCSSSRDPRDGDLLLTTSFVPNDFYLKDNAGFVSLNIGSGITVSGEWGYSL